MICDECGQESDVLEPNPDWGNICPMCDEDYNDTHFCDECDNWLSECTCGDEEDE